MWAFMVQRKPFWALERQNTTSLQMSMQHEWALTKPPNNTRVSNIPATPSGDALEENGLE